MTKFIPASEQVWAPPLADIATDVLIAAVANVVRSILLPDYERQRPGDRRPQRAIEAAETFLARRTDNARAHAAAVAKACSNARRQTFGYEHRIAEAARAVATSVVRRTDAAIRAELFEALAKTEEHLVNRLHLERAYGKEAEVRARVLAEVRSRVNE